MRTLAAAGTGVGSACCPQTPPTPLRDHSAALSPSALHRISLLDRFREHVDIFTNHLSFAEATRSVARRGPAEAKHRGGLLTKAPLASLVGVQRVMGSWDVGRQAGSVLHVSRAARETLAHGGCLF